MELVRIWRQCKCSLQVILIIEHTIHPPSPHAHTPAFCKSLTWLDVSHNQLDSLVGLQQLVNLSVLRASHNSLTTCGELSSLTSGSWAGYVYLLVLENLIFMCRFEGTYFKQQSTLGSAWNFFTETTQHSWCVPSSFERLCLFRVSFLVLSHNMFERVCVKKLKLLSKLSVSHNSLKAVPDTQVHTHEWEWSCDTL